MILEFFEMLCEYANSTCYYGFDTDCWAMHIGAFEVCLFVDIDTPNMGKYIVYHEYGIFTAGSVQLADGVLRANGDDRWGEFIAELQQIGGSRGAMIAAK